jgi:FMN reductase
VLATPIYRASFTGSLKNLLDHVPVEALMGKPCGIIAMGATAHHFLGAEWHLRDVLTWFGAMTAPTGIYLSSADFVDGAPTQAVMDDLAALIDALVRLRAATPAVSGSLGPLPLAARRR